MIRKLKTKFLIVLLGVYLAGALSIFPVTSNFMSSNALGSSKQLKQNFNVLNTVNAQEVNDWVYKPSDIEWKTSIPNNFLRITKDGQTVDGKPVVLAPSFTLTKAGHLGKIGFRTTDPSYYIESSVPGYGGYYISALQVAAINTVTKNSACSSVGTSDCSEQYVSPPSFFRDRVLNVGENATFYLELTSGDLAGFGLQSSASGTVNNISVFPRMNLAGEAFDQDFPDAEAKFTLQVYDTLEQLKAAVTSPPPPGAGGGSEGTGSGKDSPVNNKLKDCFTSTDAIFCLINLFLGAIGGLLEQFIKVVWSWIISPVLTTALSVRTYEDKFANVIYPAWIILRNLTNIAFILAIIAMGIATVFRISGWMVRDLMIKLIIGAFLVNFSLVIPQAILGIAETVQNQFLSTDSGAINAISNQLLSFTLFDNSTVNLGSYSETIRIFMNVWTMLFGFIAFCGILFIVVVRLVVIWILLMVSPLIYAAYIFPATRSFFNKWWSTFMKWAFISAAIGFMLNLTAIVTFQSRGLLVGLSGVDQATIGGNTAVAYEFMTQLIPIVFLYATVKVATSMGSGINSFVDKTLSKGAAFATGLGAGSIMGYAMKPVTTPVKNMGIWAKDKVQTGYIKGLNKTLAPSADAHKTWYGKLGAGMKGGVFNVLSGGALTSANQAARKREIETKKMEMSGIAQDYRLTAQGRKPQMQQGVLTAEYEKKLEERAREFSEQNRQQTLDNIDNLLKKRRLSDDEMIDLEAYIKKSLKSDFSFGDVVNHDPSKGKYRNITDMWRDLQGKASGVALSRAVSNVNSIAVDKDKLHLVADVDHPDNTGNQNAKINNILGSKSASEIGQVNEDVFVDHTGALKGAAGDVRQVAFGKYIARFLNPANAQKLGNDITTDQKKAYQRISVPELDRILGLAGLPLADIPVARDNFLKEIKS